MAMTSTDHARTSAGVAERARPHASARLLRAVGVCVVGGIVAGAVAGLASRVAMRISGLLAGPRPSRLVTFDGFLLGAFTLRGTIFLVVSGAVAGIIGGLTYAALRDWVAPAGRWRGLVFGLVLAVAFGRIVFDRANFDFTVFGPPTVNVALYASLFVIFGLIIAPTVARIDRRVPRLPPGSEADRRDKVTFYGVIAAGVLGLLPLVAFIFGALTGNLVQDERDLGPATAVGVMFAILVIAPSAARLRDRDARATWIGYILVAAPIGVGGYVTMREITAILTG
jgi:hypothetical protein